MSERKDAEEFPDVNHKLAAPKKLSAFEKERQAAEAKRQRAEAENAAALKAFEDSFGNEGNDDLPGSAGVRAPPSGPRGTGMGHGPGSGRYGGMPSMGPRSGPGSLGPIAGGPPPPPSLKRKRALDEAREAQEARREQEAMLSSRADSRDTLPVGVQEDDHDEPAKPTVQLSSLPPNFRIQDVANLLKDHLKIHAIDFLPPAGPGFKGRRSLAAIATLKSTTEKAQIDAAISALRDKYLGWGFRLSISRHLSSAALHPSTAAVTASSEPFGAEKPRIADGRQSLRNAPPPPDLRGSFAPPQFYESPMRGRYDIPGQSETLVSVQAPLDIATIRATHIVAERLLTEPDPMRALEIEALLMSAPSVQQDERFAFLYDSRSPAGVYYRYLLWGPDCFGNDIKEAKRRAKGLERVYDDINTVFVPPYEQVPFPSLRSLNEVVTDMDYVSSDEDSDDEGGERRFNDGREGTQAPISESSDKKRLTPVKRARLVYLMSRLPTTNARLRKGDVARVTNFAISHAGEGAEEIVDLLLLNVEKPFAYSLAAKYEEDAHHDEEDDYEPGDALPSVPDSDAIDQKVDGKREDDSSNARLIGLYLISDILSASSTAGAKNAWKYRQLFEAGFRTQNTFSHLGRLDRELKWGRLKAEQWKRKVEVVFGIWEGWSVFSSDVHAELKRSFYEPPLTQEEKAAEAERKLLEDSKAKEDKWKGKFKRVGEASPAGSPSPAPAALSNTDAEDIGGVPMDDVNGAPMAEDLDGAPMEDLDGQPMNEDIDGVPVAEDADGATVENVDGQPMDEDVDSGLLKGDDAVDSRPAEVPTKVSLSGASAIANGSRNSSGPKKRMQAADMFASDEE